MEKLLVVMELPKQKCAVKRVLLAVGIVFAIVTVCLIILASYLTLKINKLENEINSLNKENEYKRQLSAVQDKIMKKINISMRYFSDKRMTDLIRNEIEQMKTGNRSEPNTGHDLRQNLSDINDHLDVLVETVGNLSALVLRMNSSSGSTISRLRSNLNETKNDLIRLQNELTELNKSVQTDIAPFIISAVNDVRKELDMLRKSTTANVSGLWKHWNRTDAEIGDIIKMIAQQNETLHFKIAYHSDVLYSEVKDIEKKQSRFHNYTNRNMKNIRSEMNQTRQSLQHIFNAEIARVNTSWHKALEDIDGSLRLSVTKMKVKVDKIKQNLQNSMNNIIKEQNEIKDDLSKTKASFQENDRKHDSNQASEIKSMKKRIETLEGKLDSKTRNIENDIQNVQKSVNNMKNSANRVLGSYVPFILVLYYFI